MFYVGCMGGGFFLRFLPTPDGVVVSLGSLFLAVVAFLQLRRGDISVRKKTAWIYTIFFAIPFPLVYFTLSVPCAGMQMCTTRTLFKALPIASLGAVALGCLASPFVCRRMLKAKELKDGDLAGLLALHASGLGLRQPRLLLVDDQKPLAFSTAGLR